MATVAIDAAARRPRLAERRSTRKAVLILSFLAPSLLIFILYRILMGVEIGKACLQQRHRAHLALAQHIRRLDQRQIGDINHHERTPIDAASRSAASKLEGSSSKRIVPRNASKSRISFSRPGS